MGLRSWLNQVIGRTDSVGNTPVVEPAVLEEDMTTFHRTQEKRATEALALFEEDDPVLEPLANSVPAPYDASQAQIEDLLSEGTSPSFTHQDEVEIHDVSEVEDPYEDAMVEGDISETVVFDGHENRASV